MRFAPEYNEDLIENPGAYDAAVTSRIVAGMVKKFITVFQVAHPEVDWDYLQSEMEGTFAFDMVQESRQYAKMTDKQLAVVISAIERHKERQANMQRTIAEREAAKAELIKAGVQAPTGRVAITGKVVSVREVEAWGGGTTTKGLVVSEQGWKVWTTLSTIKTERPIDEILYLCREKGWGYEKSDAELLERLESSPEVLRGYAYRYDEIEVGDVVTFTATCEQSDDDPLFAFAKRPAKWSVIKAEKGED